MARTVRNAKTSTRSARSHLPARREPYWTTISLGCALGYRRGTNGGTWIAKFRDETGQRPVFGGSEKFQHDPYWRDHLLFYEYFHGDSGAGIGASHQTGWTGVVAGLVEYFGHIDAQTILQGGLAAALEKAS